MAKALPLDFFKRPALVVAKDMLGKHLVRRSGGQTSARMITEVEAYVGPQDLACHASKGLTPRTKVMFGPPGNFYVYFTYGIHWMLNIVTDKEGHPAAVLIRGLEDISGPARITKRLKITGKLNGLPAKISSGLWVEDGGMRVSPGKIVRMPRIGVEYAGGEWANKPYRFILKNPK